MEGQQKDRKGKGHKKGGNKNYNKFSYKEPEFFTTPITGFLITSNQNQEKNAVRDAYNFLNKYVENDYQREIDRILDDLETEKVEKKLKTENPVQGEETKQEESTEQETPQPVVHQSTSALLEKELKTYSKENKIFYNVDTNCKGIIFIKVNPIFKDVIDVKKVANKVCKDVRENLIPVSRFCFKAVPIQVATKASLETFQENIKSILDQKFKPGNPKKWVLHFKCRNNSKFVMKPFLDYLLENIGKEHSVDYKNPDYTIFLEINNHLMCISVLKKFNTFKNYSLQLPGSNPAQNPKKNKNPEETATPAVPKESLVGELEFEETTKQKEEENNNQQENTEAPAASNDNQQEESDEDIPLV